MVWAGIVVQVKWTVVYLADLPCHNPVFEMFCQCPVSNGMATSSQWK